MIILGNRWTQGIGFDKNHISHSVFATKAEAMKRLKNAKKALEKAELEEWYIVATIDPIGDQFELIAQIKQTI